MDIFKKCPVLENEKFLIRQIKEADADDLMAVYGDKFALPFFNSDNCHSSNFYCSKREDVENMIKYWLIAYHENREFVRFSIVDKTLGKVIGTIEMFQRKSEDFYHECGILRLDVRSDRERTELLYDILSLVTAPFFEWVGCSKIATKAAVYAVDRIEALRKMGFVKSAEPVIGLDRKRYYDYWVIQKD